MGNAWRRVHGRIKKRPTNFGWVVGESLAGSGIPTSREEMDWILGQGIGAIITMTEEALPKSWTGDIEYLHLPTPDLNAPREEDIDAAIEFAHKNIAGNRPVMVHCAAGLGRAGTILCCYLIKHGGAGADDSIREIRRLRPGSVQSEDQENAIAEYEKRNKK